MRKLLPWLLLKNLLRRLARGSKSSSQEEPEKTGARAGRGAADTFWRTDARICAPEYELVSGGGLCLAASAGYFRHARSAGDAPHAATGEGSAARNPAAQ